jgi:hypothetical protein
MNSTGTEDAPQAVRALDEQQMAQQIEHDNPNWIVVFGVYTREFVAFPRFAAPPHTIVVATYPAALPPRMQEVERRFLVSE